MRSLSVCQIPLNLLLDFNILFSRIHQCLTITAVVHAINRVTCRGNCSRAVSLNLFRPMASRQPILSIALSSAAFSLHLDGPPGSGHRYFYQYDELLLVPVSKCRSLFLSKSTDDTRLVVFVHKLLFGTETLREYRIFRFYSAERLSVRSVSLFVQKVFQLLWFTFCALLFVSRKQ
jgi:hypothetical protein